MKYGFLFICMSLCFGGFSQTSDSNPVMMQQTIRRIPSPDFNRLFNQYFDFGFTVTPFTFSMQRNPMEIIQFNYLPGLFCRIEHQIEAKSGLAPRFRLGSLNYTEWMEGKGEFYTRYMK